MNGFNRKRELSTWTLSERVNQSKIRRDHDEWHDVAVPGLDNPDPVPLALEDDDQYETSIAGGDYAEAYFGEQTHWFCQLASVMLWNF